MRNFRGLFSKEGNKSFLCGMEEHLFLRKENFLREETKVFFPRVRFLRRWHCLTRVFDVLDVLDVLSDISIMMQN